MGLYWVGWGGGWSWKKVEKRGCIGWMTTTALTRQWLTSLVSDYSRIDQHFTLSTVAIMDFWFLSFIAACKNYSLFFIFHQMWNSKSGGQRKLCPVLGQNVVGHWWTKNDVPPGPPEWMPTSVIDSRARSFVVHVIRKFPWAFLENIRHLLSGLGGAALAATHSQFALLRWCMRSDV